MINRLARSLALGALLFLTYPAIAVDLEVRLLAQGSAILTINGKQVRLKDGERSPEGVKLVSSTTQAAIVEYEGAQQTLTLSRRIASRFVETEPVQVRISQSQGGHYVADGSINGHNIRMMVDTGATSVAMNRRTAERLGINYRTGEVIQVSTANGIADAYRITLDRVAVGNLEQRYVEALVTDSDYPDIVLLGNSYLGAVEMRVDRGVLLLESKY
ncbi:TIGR02281 family clan AA aspartic protease [Marinimicrobium sp. ABcell2]|uniref:retropepsin-like aspartic protease family protein n=1 Tax=Marinimicrobium sp. ABcell2 TaxID=3069751 RepID=UPI0027B47147|nr:TIGR02281 family clan AA aspartic protease [Marinimicrobium sp. ABcell2]MDQ2075787.1 TIGR02281 family clan AA aspartic protease [Marinimicrobium sp. ABcell2]